MQRLVVDLFVKLPNYPLGVPKLKSFWLRKLKEEINNFCPLSKNFSIGSNHYLISSIGLNNSKNEK